MRPPACEATSLGSNRIGSGRTVSRSLVAGWSVHASVGPFVRSFVRPYVRHSLFRSVGRTVALVCCGRPCRMTACRAPDLTKADHDYENYSWPLRHRSSHVQSCLLRHAVAVSRGTHASCMICTMCYNKNNCVSPELGSRRTRGLK